MKFLVTSDIHVTDRPKDEYRWDIFRWLQVQATNRKVDRIYILGDLTDQKDHHSAVLVNRTVEELVALATLCEVRLIMGNHDYIDKELPFFRFMEGLGVSYFHKPEAIDGHVFLPHTKHPVRDWKPVQADIDSAQFVFAHQTFTGAVASNGFKMEGAGQGWFKNTDAYVISGDIHVPQVVGDVIYCGAPHPVRFGDEWQPRVLYWNGSKLRSLKRTTIRKATLNCTVRDVYGKLEEYDDGDQVRIRLHLRREQFGDWDELRTNIRELAERRGIYVAGLEIRELRIKSQPRRFERKDKHEGAHDTFEDYCKEQKIADTLREAGSTIIQKVQLRE